jgi:hypothetical protein
MGRVKRHQWGKAIAPIGNVIQCSGVRHFIDIEHLQLRTDRAGIRQWQPDLKAEMRGRVIQRGNLQGIVLFGDDDAGPNVLFRFNRRGAGPRELTFDAVGRQAWQPKVEDTPPVSRKGTHHISIP